MLVKWNSRAQNQEGTWFRDTRPAGAPKMPTARSRACLGGRVPEDLEPPAGPRPLWEGGGVSWPTLSEGKPPASGALVSGCQN